jgi:predicted Rdx family selenoprotein
VFDVRVDGQLIFSKHQLGRFPEPDEVEDAIRSLPNVSDRSEIRDAFGSPSRSST